MRRRFNCSWRKPAPTVMRSITTKRRTPPFVRRSIPNLDFQNRAKDLEFAQKEAPRITENLASAQKQRDGWQQKLDDLAAEQTHVQKEIERLELKVIEMKHAQGRTRSAARTSA